MNGFWFLSCSRDQDPAQPEQPPKDEVEFVAWGLGWDMVENQLKRELAKFSIAQYADRRPITSLPVYPLNRKGPIRQLSWQGLLKGDESGKSSCQTRHAAYTRRRCVSSTQKTEVR